MTIFVLGLSKEDAMVLLQKVVNEVTFFSLRTAHKRVNLNNRMSNFSFQMFSLNAFFERFAVTQNFPFTTLQLLSFVDST